ncbi:GNAT family N-acetyltransferase [Arthrobacter sp. RHLT1-20]
MGGPGQWDRRLVLAARRGGAELAGGRGQAEIGWSLAPEARGQGIASETARALLKLGLGEPGIRRIDAKLDALDIALAALCQRVGMRLKSRQVDKWHYKDECATEVAHAVLADEYKSWQSAGPRH